MMTEYLSEPVFDFEPDRGDGLEAGFHHPVDRFAGLAATGYTLDAYALTAMRFRLGFLGWDRARIRAINDFFDARMGRLYGFWLPSWTPDIVVAEAFFDTDDTLTVAPVEYAETWLSNAATGRHVMIWLPDGTQVFRKIISATDDTVTIDSAVGTACTEAELSSLVVCFLFWVRFDQDEISNEFITTSIARIALSFVTCDEDAFTTTTTTTTSTTTTEA